MNGNKEYLTDIIEGRKTRFIIPVYQRNYDWKPEHCGRFFDDLVDVALTGRNEHFFGSIVSQTPREERVIIDGQQRITTLFLLLAALRHQLQSGVIVAEAKDLADDIELDYLIDKKNRRDQKLRLKLIKSDSEAFAAILDGKEEEFIMDSNVTQNYLYFLERIANMNITADALYKALSVLCVIDIKLDPGDDAQLIFESLNSTGLGLTEADKIRNYVLMNLDQESQEEYYEKYWNVIEKCTDYEVSEFIRYYLAAKEAKTPSTKKVYPAFREYVKKNYSKGPEDIDIEVSALLSDMLNYAKHYKTIMHHDSSSRKINEQLRHIELFDATVTLPFLFNLMQYWTDELIGEDSMVEVLKTLDSYLFRRWTSGVASNALNKIFETLHSDVLKGVETGAEYSDVLNYLLLSKSASSRFPTDDEFSDSIRKRDFYRIQNRKFYLYDRLENEGSKEHVAVVKGLENGDYSIEHVMPQVLNAEWKKALGEDWERIHSQWVNKMANLTITAYNSEYSNRRFDQKRDMKDGFADSGFRMNKWIGEQEAWGEDELKAREDALVEQFLELWPLPTSTYVPVKVMPEEAALDPELDFTGRRISAFNFLGVHYSVKQWNDMLVLVLKLLCELEPAKMHALADKKDYPGSSFKSEPSSGFTEIAPKLYARTSSSTNWKMTLLQALFEHIGLSGSDLTFIMPVETPLEED